MKKALKYIGIFSLIAIIMAGGAAAIYTLKHQDTFLEDSKQFLEEQLRIMASSGVSAVKDKIEDEIALPTTAQQTTTQHALANAGGEIDNSNLTDQEKGYDEYIKNLETSSPESESSNVMTTTIKEKDTTTAPTEPTTTVTAPEITTRQPETTTVKERETTPAPTTTVKERETTPAPTTTVAKEPETTPAPTTTAKKQGKVVTDEKIRTAMIQLGYDPDNYVASDLTTAEITAILRLARGEVATSNPNRVIHESVDYSTGTLEYTGPQPKPMG